MDSFDQTRIRLAANLGEQALNSFQTEKFSFALLAFRRSGRDEIELGVVSQGEPRLVIEALEEAARRMRAEE